LKGPPAKPKKQVAAKLVFFRKNKGVRLHTNYKFITLLAELKATTEELFVRKPEKINGSKEG